MPKRRKIKKGDTFKLFYGKTNPANIAKIHICAIVDKDVIVYKHWSRRKGWIYQVDYIGKLDFLLAEGHLKKHA